VCGVGEGVLGEGGELMNRQGESLWGVVLSSAGYLLMVAVAAWVLSAPGC
jgi:hypothetical protein